MASLSHLLATIPLNPTVSEEIIIKENSLHPELICPIRELHSSLEPGHHPVLPVSGGVGYIPIRNMRTIAETLAEHAPVSQDPATLAAAVWTALKRSIVQNISWLAEDLPIITIDPWLEQLLLKSMRGGVDVT